MISRFEKRRKRESCLRYILAYIRRSSLVIMFRTSNKLRRTRSCDSFKCGRPDIFVTFLNQPSLAQSCISKNQFLSRKCQLPMTLGRSIFCDSYPTAASAADLLRAGSRAIDGREERQDWRGLFGKTDGREGEKRETMLHKLVEQSFLKAVGSNEILMTFS